MGKRKKARWKSNRGKMERKIRKEESYKTLTPLESPNGVNPFQTAGPIIKSNLQCCVQNITNQINRFS